MKTPKAIDTGALPVITEFPDFNTKVPHSAIITITKDMATWLYENHHRDRNRPTDQPWIEAMARDMKNKKWGFHSVPIVVGWDGALLDGHQRLLACALEAGGASFKTTLNWGVDPETFKVIDNHRPKRARDLLYIDGMDKNHVQTAAAATLMIRYNKSVLGSSRYKVTTSDVVEFVRDHPDLVYWIDKLCVKGIRVFAAPIAAVIALGVGPRVSRERAEFFADRIVSGDNLVKGSPILALRNRLLTGGQERTNIIERFYLAISAWNAYVEGRDMVKVQLPKSGHDTPKVRGATH